jgi:hypothetical protein
MYMIKIRPPRYLPALQRGLLTNCAKQKYIGKQSQEDLLEWYLSAAELPKAFSVNVRIPEILRLILQASSFRATNFQPLCQKTPNITG